MTTFSHTSWTVFCNGTDGDGRPCVDSGNSDNLDLRDGTAAMVRSLLKRAGWLVNVPNPDPSDPYRRLDYCPRHKAQVS
jgi:hypothetical protein